MNPAAGSKTTAASFEEDWAASYADYAPLPGIPDEFIGADGRPKPHWRELLDHLSANDRERSLAVARRHIRDLGISYRVGGETQERIWPVSSLPLLIEESDWQAISAGIVQRAEMFEALLADVYGPARMVADGVLPAAVVAGSKEYLRPLSGVKPPGGRWLHLYAADIGRGPDGRWWVLNDRAQAPSGAGYALENRLAISRAYHTTYAGMNVQRLAPFFRAFRGGLAAKTDRADPRICLMTPGPYSQTYSEQSYLARYLGFLLVEGDDLVVHDGKVHVRTIAGLKRADVLWRRVDADYIDPLELNGASRLGVPQLISAIRSGSVVVANMPGAGFIESRALLSFMPRIAQHLTGADLALPNIATWWCGQPQARERVLDSLDTLSIAGAFDDRVPGFAERNLLGPELAPDVAARVKAAITARGLDYVGQELVRLSTAPVFQDGRLVPRPFVLRVFAAATPDGWQVMPGGFCLISDNADARAVSMGDGVQSADVWVLSQKPVPVETLLPSTENVNIRRILGNLPSRAADNLFWFGRYLERAEATLRIVRSLCAKSVDIDLASGVAADSLQRLAGLLLAWGAVPAEQGAQRTLTTIATALGSETQYGSVLSSVRMAYGAASVIRERLSVDSWKLLGVLETQLQLKATDIATEAEAYEAADRALVTLAAISGLAQENINRVAGWRFLDIGRRVERAINTCRMVRAFAGDSASADDLDILLDLIDSQITYRSRYLIGVALAPVRDMALLDPYNPRSVSFQIGQLRDHIDTLPTLNDDGIPEEPKRFIDLFAGEIASAAADDIEPSSVLAFEQTLMRFADAIASRYFLQRPEGLKVKSTSGLA
ncbi:circularly permuted type 2 ATP-grasp protein [Bradyrhizobium sp. U87765 SZCCT0131]|uniref:circularly permuted type 2 ATP-grasp protein n=1 Tax=unclassified Bradyrhizobium TaxID=2631580 RepID=UPI001BADA037|nr:MULTISPECIES: circularly permuted type 2 ATP-grasp protein [unclassified Bradyrhizobium]MBR1222715.1 circularly permuted type 2 ATP-grasp protein [Bradyrhizobium sp. U87765 SZCCT0131]MBR1265204.1 circularly permuted type 2 ATP-grasp protein [Bradyrhizobium sp. U87765 SZCCT0134]MBR1303017.1 circularly permuted type 2 ATP-grasp protein [Bradyrhizobium sp. U87765 SZCCT0110]MBR1323715.1 circularly permuted type 2 ATP-grasp protein [Bradyrhizobium sp. U87765 SZCCT0109]MBR1346946.1 circularly per